jgi:hypothetical protein
MMPNMANVTMISIKVKPLGVRFTISTFLVHFVVRNHFQLLRAIMIQAKFAMRAAGLMVDAARQLIAICRVNLGKNGAFLLVIDSPS